MESVHKVLLIRRNGYGDMICALPLLRSLRAARPDLQLDVLASEKNAVILSNLKLVDKIHLYQRGTGVRRNHYLNLRNVLKPVLAERYDLLVAIKGGFSPLLAVISYATRIPWRLGYVPSRGHPLDFCFNLKVELPVEREHQIESCLRLLEPLGIPRGVCDLKIRLDPVHEAGAERLLTQWGVKTGDFVLFNISSERSESRWPWKSWVELACGLYEKFGISSVACGLNRDRDLLESIREHAGKAIRGICSPDSIHGFAALAGHSKFLVCGDGGPMHVGAAIGCPVFVLFSATDPKIWKPYQVSFDFIQKGRLISQITSAEVLSRVEHWLPTLGR